MDKITVDYDGKLFLVLVDRKVGTMHEPDDKLSAGYSGPARAVFCACRIAEKAEELGLRLDDPPVSITFAATKEMAKK